jgi:hypothetical protein
MTLNDNRFIIWLMSLTAAMRYFVIALMVHVIIILVLASIPPIVSVGERIITMFDTPPPLTGPVDDVDPFAAFRDFDYKGPTLGDGAGTPGRGPGGIPAAIMTAEGGGESSVAEVIGVFSDAATASARPMGVPGIVTPSFGAIGTTPGITGIRGPGGGGFGGRIGPMRAQAIRQGGGTQAAETAVLGGLRWLKDRQRPDGTWEISGRGGAGRDAGTALAVLAFLGYGETPETSEEFGRTIQRGLEALIRNLGNDGIVSSKNMYAQGAVTLALAEGFGMTGHPALREPLDRAVNAILRAQQVKKQNSANQGGWRYSPTATDADVSVSGWLIMALKSAHLAGIEVPQQAFDQASRYLWNMYKEPGFGYSSPGTAPNMTGIAVLCLQFMGHGTDPRLRKALDYLRNQKVDWNVDKQRHPLYGWYYITQAMFQGGGQYWTYWNGQIRDSTIRAQRNDGSWVAPPGGTDLSDPVYATALSCLILEVYYRYLPLYRQMEGAPSPHGLMR